MPLQKKKWTKSKANNYISRKKACQKLQISLPSFRKLCILKGIYPHDPKKRHRKEGDRRVYYNARDIKYLRREPILWQWREQNTFRKKLTKHKGRHNWDKVKRMQPEIPQVSIDHLVRERYPTFNDALRDLDDCVTFLFLFASLPSGIVPSLTAIRRMECQKLCREYKYYIIKHGILTKAFISVKGIYYQCRFKNKYDVTWIVPHQFTHSIPEDVDYRVMSSFLDFYQTMLKFVVFKLFKGAHMNYPPFGDIDYDLTNLSMTALMQKKFSLRRTVNVNKRKRKRSANVSKADFAGNDGEDDEEDGDEEEEEKQKVVQLDLNQILNKSEQNDDESKSKAVSKSQQDDEEKERYSRKEWSRSNLFEDFKFLLNRETPQMELEFVVLAMGGTVVFEQDCKTLKQRNDASITHQVVDRKIADSQQLSTRQYVQPQWVFDCLNTGSVIPTEHYQPGIQCPPHLSPFVVYNDGAHKPSQAFVLEHWQQIAKQFGGFVPSKKLLENKQQKRKQEEDEEAQKEDEEQKVDEEEEEDEEIGMNLDIADIMDMDEIQHEEEAEEQTENVQEDEEVDENEDADGFLDEEEDEEEDDDLVQREKKDTESMLSKQRIKIANRQRRMSTKKETKHSLDTDGIPGSKEERIKVNLARSMMQKRVRRTYDKIRRKKTSKGKHAVYMDRKRQRFESTQMQTKQ